MKKYYPYFIRPLRLIGASVTLVAIAIGCSSLDQNLLDLTNAISAMQEPETFLIEADNPWKEAKVKDQELKSLLTQFATMESVEPEQVASFIEKVKAITQLDLEYLKGAVTFYKDAYPSNKRFRKVYLHLELMKYYSYRALIQYIDSVEKKKMAAANSSRDEVFALETAVSSMVASLSQSMNDIDHEYYNIKFNADDFRSLRQSVRSELLSQLKSLGVSIDTQSGGVSAKLSSQLPGLGAISLPPQRKDFIEIVGTACGAAKRYSHEIKCFKNAARVSEYATFRELLNSMCDRGFDGSSIAACMQAGSDALTSHGNLSPNEKIPDVMSATAQTDMSLLYASCKIARSDSDPELVKCLESGANTLKTKHFDTQMLSGICTSSVTWSDQISCIENAIENFGDSGFQQIAGLCSLAGKRESKGRCLALGLEKAQLPFEKQVMGLCDLLGSLDSYSSSDRVKCLKEGFKLADKPRISQAVGSCEYTSVASVVSNCIKLNVEPLINR